MIAPLAVDTSIALPILLTSHPDHTDLFAWSADRTLALSGHALAETYSVLTRLPRHLRVRPVDLARALDAEFDSPVGLAPAVAQRLPRVLADLDVAGGAVYDALVALAAREAGLVLATRDARALDTYRRVGVDVEVVVS